MPTIAVVNQSTILTDDEVARYAKGYQLQVTQDFIPEPSDGLEAAVVFKQMGDVDDLDWQLIFQDDTPEPGALGYHFLTERGRPRGFVFARSDREAGLEPSVTGSHELLEMLGDPWIARWVMCPPSGTPGLSNPPLFYAEERCDPVEAQEYLIMPDGVGAQAAIEVKVSNFVYPSWWQVDGKAPFDYLGNLSSPFEVASGGYITVFDPRSGWRSEFGGSGWQRHPGWSLRRSVRRTVRGMERKWSG